MPPGPPGDGRPCPPPPPAAGRRPAHRLTAAPAPRSGAARPAPSPGRGACVARRRPCSRHLSAEQMPGLADLSPVATGATGRAEEAPSRGPRRPPFCRTPGRARCDMRAECGSWASARRSTSATTSAPRRRTPASPSPSSSAAASPRAPRPAQTQVPAAAPLGTLTTASRARRPVRRPRMLPARHPRIRAPPAPLCTACAAALIGQTCQRELPAPGAARARQRRGSPDRNRTAPPG